VGIPAGSSSASFFYGDTKAGTATIITAAPGLAAPAAVTAVITAAAPSILQFGAINPSVKKNEIITPAVTVKFLDEFGNQTDVAAHVTLQSACNVKGSLTQQGIAGVASFPGLSIIGSGNMQVCKLTATSGTLPAATSNTFNVN
jgi:hypothetical protein